jgi:hypothetical protein
MSGATRKYQDHDIGRRTARRPIGALGQRCASPAMLAGPRCARSGGAKFASLEPAQGDARR